MSNEGLGYLCGILCGRGFVKRGRNNCVGLHTKNARLAHQFAESLRLVRGFSPIIKEQNINGKIYFIIDAYGKDVIKLFTDIGFFPTRRNWSPPQIANTDKGFRVEFLSGFFDATSVVYFNREKFYLSGSGYRYIRVTSVNGPGLRAVKSLLGMENIESNLRTSDRGPNYLTIRGGWRLKTFAGGVNLRTTKKEMIETSLAPIRPRVPRV